MPTPKNSKKKGTRPLRHQGEYLDFVAWVALPTELRQPKTQQDLAKEFGVGQDTLSEWKQRPDFWEDVSKKRREWGRERTPDVLLALFKRIQKTGGAAEVRLWMECIEGWQSKVIVAPNPYADLQEMTDEELHLELEKWKAFYTKK